MTKLEEFMSAGSESLSLQVKFLKAESRSSRESSYGLRFPVRQSLAVQAGTIQRLPESIWLLAHKIVAFSQSYIQQAGWHDGLLNWMLVREPWWTLTYQDYSAYADLFTKQEWFETLEILSGAHKKMAENLSKRAPNTEDQAVLWFLKDSQHFVEQMYRRL